MVLQQTYCKLVETLPFILPRGGAYNQQKQGDNMTFKAISPDLEQQASNTSPYPLEYINSLV